MSEQVDVLKVLDRDSGQEALAIVRSVNGLVALTLSLEDEADVQVVFSPEDCAQLIARLQNAVDHSYPRALAA